MSLRKHIAEEVDAPGMHFVNPHSHQANNVFWWCLPLVKLGKSVSFSLKQVFILRRNKGD